MLHGLAQVLRALGKATVVQFLFDRPNQLGAWDLGVLPAALPGLRPVADAAARAVLEQAWGAAIPSEPGADLDRMLDLAAAGTMGVLYLAGADPLLSYPDRELVRRALAATDLVIVQDAFLTDTVGVADVVLPAASYGEEAGTFVNNEGRTQRVNRFREPAFEARPNLEIFSFVAALRGHTLDPSGPGEVVRRDRAAGPALRRPRPRAASATTARSLRPDRSRPTRNWPRRRHPLPSGPTASSSSPATACSTADISPNARRSSESIADEPYRRDEPAGRRGARPPRPRSGRSSDRRHGALRAQLKLNKRFPDGLVFVPENYRALRLNALMKAGEYPCPVEVRKADAAGGGRGRRTGEQGSDAA